LAPLVDAWDEAHREFAIAFEGLADEDLWKRAHPLILSVGELAGHICYWEAVWTMGGGDDRPDLSKLPIQSPMITPSFRYYTTSVESMVNLELGTGEVVAEVARVHEAARSIAVRYEMEDPYPGQWGTWGYLVQYQAFQVAYHTGQAFSVRHLMGGSTPDN
jgi:hypothetical protein